uniref:Uncharacterized protein n=1 Tax=Anopheles merus TaxID=30066 RepID=A0A182VF32_ANOME
MPRVLHLKVGMLQRLGRANAAVRVRFEQPFEQLVRIGPVLIAIRVADRFRLVVASTGTNGMAPLAQAGVGRFATVIATVPLLLVPPGWRTRAASYGYSTRIAAARTGAQLAPIVDRAEVLTQATQAVRPFGQRFRIAEQRAVEGAGRFPHPLVPEHLDHVRERGQIVVVAEERVALAQQPEKDDARRPDVDGGRLVRILQQHLRRPVAGRTGPRRIHLRPHQTPVAHLRPAVTAARGRRRWAAGGGGATTGAVGPRWYAGEIVRSTIREFERALERFPHRDDRAGLLRLLLLAFGSNSSLGAGIGRAQRQHALIRFLREPKVHQHVGAAVARAVQKIARLHVPMDHTVQVDALERDQQLLQVALHLGRGQLRVVLVERFLRNVVHHEPDRTLMPEAVDQPDHVPLATDLPHAQDLARDSGRVARRRDQLDRELAPGADRQMLLAAQRRQRDRAERALVNHAVHDVPIPDR